MSAAPTPLCDSHTKPYNLMSALLLKHILCTENSQYGFSKLNATVEKQISLYYIH